MDSATKVTSANAYREVGRRSRIEGASPHKLIELLLEALAAQVEATAQAIVLTDIPARGAAINKAVDILGELRMALNFDQGGQIATNLDTLYAYMQASLISAHQNNDGTELPQLQGMVTDLQTTWKAIAEKPQHQRILATESRASLS